VDVTPEALDLIVLHTKGYPYFLQEWGKHSWDAADGSPITAFTVPLFDEFMRRIMPGDAWRSS